MYSPLGFTGYVSASDDFNNKQYQDDLKLLSKFYRKYPEVKYFPQASTLNVKFGGTIQITHPAATFIKKQRELLNKGYTEDKAFEVVEKSLHKYINT